MSSQPWVRGPKRDGMPARIAVDQERIAELCRRHRIRELALFGSVLRDDFGLDSDVDVLADFALDAKVSLFDLVRIQAELALILGRNVDLVDRRGLRNPFRRAEILRTAERVYAA